MDASPTAHNGRCEQDRSLRIVTIIAMFPALGLLIASGVLSGNPLPALGLLPMGMSCLVSMTALGSKKQDSYVKYALPGADFATATFLMVMMVLSWVTMSNSHWLSASNAILGAYGLIPLLLNFCIHAYIALRSPSILFQPRPCPNCNHIPPSVLPRWQRPGHVALPADSGPAIRRAQSAGPGHSRSSKEIYAQQPFMHAYDGDARESSEFQTSGFNTPRQSEDTLRPSGETLRSDGVRESREGRFDRKDAGSLV